MKRTVTIAVIDIGTNTILLLVAAISNEGKIRPLLYEQRIPRLGKGVDAAGRLNFSLINTVISVLQEYRSLMAPHQPATTIVFGTSAVRDAENREELIHAIRSETGMDLEVLSGTEEALWTYRGAISGFDLRRGTTVLDIGGGSTEIAYGAAGGLLHQWSLEIGSVRMTERCFLHNPPTSRELLTAQQWVRRELNEIPPAGLSDSTLIGVAGTATTLALLDQGLREFRIEAVSGYRLGREKVEQIYARLTRLSTEEILNLSPLMHGRADIITAGALILLSVMERFGFNGLIVSERGVRYGIAIREWEKLSGKAFGVSSPE